jgi:hypothetical protein
VAGLTTTALRLARAGLWLLLLGPRPIPPPLPWPPPSRPRRGAAEDCVTAITMASRTAGGTSAQSPSPFATQRATRRSPGLDIDLKSTLMYMLFLCVCMCAYSVTSAAVVLVSADSSSHCSCLLVCFAFFYRYIYIRVCEGVLQRFPKQSLSLVMVVTMISRWKRETEEASEGAQLSSGHRCQTLVPRGDSSSCSAMSKIKREGGIIPGSLSQREARHTFHAQQRKTVNAEWREPPT